MRETLRIIKQEHRNLFRVINFLEQVVQVDDQGPLPDLVFVGELIAYIETFTDRFHHPKEDQFLFRVLVRRDPSARPIIEELEEEHIACPAALRSLQQDLEALQARPDNLVARVRFRTGVIEYLRLQTKHIQKEEGIVLPMAERALTEEDWEAIDTVFADHDDPVFGLEARQEQRALYDRIVDMASTPFGLKD